MSIMYIMSHMCMYIYIYTYYTCVKIVFLTQTTHMYTKCIIHQSNTKETNSELRLHINIDTEGITKF